MYKEFYGLREMPFNITPDPKFLFLSPTHYEALQHLRYGIAEKKGFIVLTGEVGCGKTTVIRKLLEEIEGKDIETALIMNPRLSEAQLLKAIISELGLTPSGRTKYELLDQLNQHLLQLNEEGRDIVVMIDESQNLSFEALEHVRLLSNLETNTQKLLQIILIGQPELKEKLQQKRLRQLRQRVLVSYDLKPLTLEETKGYIQHRLTLSGSTGRPYFTDHAIKRVYQSSGGIPRLINSICDKAVLSAFIKSSDEIGFWDVRRAVGELELK